MLSRLERIVIGTIVVVILIGGMWAFYDLGNLDAANWQQGRSNGQPLVEALKNYELDHGNYPQSLEQLIPDNLSEIPRPAPGYEYEYVVCNDEYVLVFEMRLGSYFGYYNKTDEWSGGDDIPPIPYFWVKKCDS